MQHPDIVKNQLFLHRNLSSRVIRTAPNTVVKVNGKTYPGLFQIDVPEGHVSDPGNMLVAFLHHHPFDPIQNFCPFGMCGACLRDVFFSVRFAIWHNPVNPVNPAIRHHRICILDFHAFIPIDPATSQYPAEKTNQLLITAEIIAVFNQSVLNPAQFRVEVA